MSSVIGIICLAIMIYLSVMSRKYNNPFKLIMIIAKKGTGKSTTLCKYNMQYKKAGWTTYSTSYVPDSYKVDPGDIGYYEFERNSVLFCDEIGLIWHARDFKNFAKEVREWFKLQRHRKIIVYAFSQSFDIDKGLRDLCDEIYIAKKYFGVFCVLRKIIKEIDIVEATAESESRFVDNLKLVPWFIPGGRKITYIPKYARYFDSFEAPELKHKEFEYVPMKYFSKFHVLPQIWLFKRWYCEELCKKPFGSQCASVVVALRDYIRILLTRCFT